MLHSLGVSPASGLMAAEVARRQAKYGPNRLATAARPTLGRLLLRQFTDPLILLLLGAAALSAAIGHLGDAITILAIVALNAALGFTQEYRAEKALSALARMLVPRARVRREGAVQEVDSSTLVPGDIVLLALGDQLPADLRLLEVQDLSVDESALTGESVGVSKAVEPVAPDAALAERRCMAFMGTHVVRGRAVGVAVATGLASQFGQIALLTQAVQQERTPLARELASLGRRLGVVGVGMAALVATLGALAGRDALEMLLLGISLAVAVVPEGLPAVVTITLALGVREMARHRALARRLAAAETLGAATVICTDKTGTLTRGEMTVQRIWTQGREFRATGAGYDPSGHFEIDGQRIVPTQYPGLIQLLRTASVCNHAQISPDVSGTWTLRGEPTEGALITAARKAGVETVEADARGELPFDSNRKRMTVLENCGASWCAHVKGAPDVLLPLTTHVQENGVARPWQPGELDAAVETFQSMASQGLRTLALAHKQVKPQTPLDGEQLERGLALLGIVGLIDPPRPEARQAMALAADAGIRVLMITGDAPQTAVAVAQQVGLPAKAAVRGPEIDTLDDAALDEALRTTTVLARTTPAHKLRVVERLQAQGHVVAMTGDGVNDAPALKKANVGVAMGIRGTDVAKGASDLILMDDNFATIIGAVREGRRQYENIRRFVHYLLSSNTGEVIAILASVLIGGPLILLPVQILWMNLVTDGVTAVALGLEPAHASLMQRPPRLPGSHVVSTAGARNIVGLGAAVAAVGLVLFYGVGASHPAQEAQTLAFCGLVLAQKFNVLNFRAMGQPLSSVGFFTNPHLILALFAMVALQVAAVYVPVLSDMLHTTPLALTDWLWIVGLSLPVFLVPEFVRCARARRRRTAT